MAEMRDSATIKLEGSKKESITARMSKPLRTRSKSDDAKVTTGLVSPVRG